MISGPIGKVVDGYKGKIKSKNVKIPGANYY
jgi:hypothetical protein